MAKRSKKADLPLPRPQDIATKAEPFIKRIEYLDEERAEKNAEFAEGKKIIVEEAERAGIQPKALRAILRRRKAIRAERDALEKFDIDEKAQWEALADAFGDSPFGEHARSLASMMRSGEVSVSVHHAKTADQRDDEEYLAQIGRMSATPHADAFAGRSDGDDIDNLTR